MSVTGPGPSACTTSCTWPSMRLTVKVEKSGALKSGVCTATPWASSFERKNAALDDWADEAKPCR